MKKATGILAASFVMFASVATAANLCPVYVLMNHGSYTTYYAVYDPVCTMPDILDAPNGLQLGCSTPDCVPFVTSVEPPESSAEQLVLQPKRKSVLVKVTYLDQKQVQGPPKPPGPQQDPPANEKAEKHKTQKKLQKKGMKFFPTKSTKRAGVTLSNLPVKHINFSYDGQEYLAKIFWMNINPKDFDTTNETIKQGKAMQHGIGYQIAAGSETPDVEGTVADQQGRTFKVSVEIVEGDTRTFNIILKKGL